MYRMKGIRQITITNKSIHVTLIPSRRSVKYNVVSLHEEDKFTSLQVSVRTSTNTKFFYQIANGDQ